MGAITATLSTGLIIAAAFFTFQASEVSMKESRSTDFMNKSVIKFVPAEKGFADSREIQSIEDLKLEPMLLFYSNRNIKRFNGEYKILEVKKIGRDTSESDIHRSDRETIRKIELVPSALNSKYSNIEIIHREQTKTLEEERTNHKILRIHEIKRDVVIAGQSPNRILMDVYNEISKGKFEIYSLELYKLEGQTFEVQKLTRPVVVPKPRNINAKVKKRVIKKKKLDLNLSLKEVMDPKGKVHRNDSINGEVEILDGKLVNLYASLDSNGEAVSFDPGFDDNTKAHNQFSYNKGDDETQGMASGAIQNENSYFLYFTSGVYKGYRLRFEPEANDDERYEADLAANEARYAMEEQEATLEYDNDSFDSYENESEEIGDRQVAALAARSQVELATNNLVGEDRFIEEYEAEQNSFISNRVDDIYRKLEEEGEEALTDSEVQMIDALADLQDAEGGYNFSM